MTDQDKIDAVTNALTSDWAPGTKVRVGVRHPFWIGVIVECTENVVRMYAANDPMQTIGYYARPGIDQYLTPCSAV